LNLESSIFATAFHPSELRLTGCIDPPISVGGFPKKSKSFLLNRDVNASINIKSFALKNILSGTDRKNQGELPTLVGALTLEAQPIAFGVGG